MAGLIVLLLAVDTGLTGWLLAQLLHMRKVCEVLSEQQQAAWAEIDALRGHDA